MKTPAEVEIVQECILCSEVVENRDIEFENKLGLISPYAVQYCMSCKLRWLSPRPTLAAYSELYSKQDYLSSVESYSSLAEVRAPYFKDRIKKIETYFVAPREDLQILEIGSATGEFVNEALLLGHKAIGIEPSIGSREIALKQYGIELLDVELDHFSDGRFDVIHMNHVFEHLSQPVDVLAECSRLLKKGGLLIIEIPQQINNDLDRLKNIIGLRKPSRFDVYSLHHTYFYTPYSISLLLNKEGYRVDHLVTCNSKRTPIKPFKIGNMFLLSYLWLSDKFHKGGNIIEIFATRI